MSSISSPPRMLVSVDEAAAHLGTSTRFVRRLVAERRIRFYKLGRHVRLSIPDLDLFIDSGAIDPV